MKLDEQVCSLELSKKLKDLGMKQESLFYWQEGIIKYYTFTKEQIEYECNRLEDNLRCSRDCEHCSDSIRRDYGLISAFTVAELGEMLLATGCHFNFSGNNGIQLWCCHKYNGNISTKVVNDIREADCRAKMLIWCIENGTVIL